MIMGAVAILEGEKYVLRFGLISRTSMFCFVSLVRTILYFEFVLNNREALENCSISSLNIK